MSRFLKKGISFNRKKLVLVVVLTLAVLVVTGFAWSYKKVNVIADGRQFSVNTLDNNAEAVLTKAGVALKNGDEYRLSTQKVMNGTTIEVYRAVPITVVYKGQSQTVVTGKPTVGEVAESLGLVKDNIKLEPGSDAKVVPDMTVVATTLSEKIVEKQEAELFQVIRRPDPTLEKGVEEVENEGKDGVKSITLKIKFVDDVQNGEEVLAEKVIVPATPEVIRVGVRDTVETSRGSMRFRRIDSMEATAYNPWDGGGAGITASGIQARHGVVAVDPGIIPLGTRVYIPGYGLALAADTGGDIIGNRIDLCFESYAEAIHFGRRTVKVYILE
ncbi:MAG: G5 domain-containing protein [Pelosinus sp.]|nr:G5 domain-containing protein [Pelosinus sp.]